MRAANISRWLRAFLFTAVLAGVGVCSPEARAWHGDNQLTIEMMQGEPRVGDFDYNFKLLEAAYLKADARGVDVLVTSELFDCGYAAGELFFREEFAAEADRFYERARLLTMGRKTRLLLGHIARTPEHQPGKPLQNVASLLDDGHLAYRYAKMLLPTYSVFEEWRYFEPGTESTLFRFKGRTLLIRICEDFWREQKVLGRVRYAVDPIAAADGQKIDLAISLSASPYDIDKQAVTESVHADVARRIHAPLIWNGMVGGVDGLLFHGRSFVLNAEGKTLERLPSFKPASATVTLSASAPDKPARLSVEVPQAEADYDRNPREIDQTIDALIYGIRQYYARTGSLGAIVGNSGGIDSAVVLTLARLAVGPDRVRSYKLPSPYTASSSNTDADELALRLGIDHRHSSISIEAAFDAVIRTLGDAWNPDGVGAENTQARLRMLFLQYISNELPGWLVLGTANKTELAFGYDTFGGGDKNSLQIIGDLWKTQVFAIAIRLNERFGNLIPEGIIKKIPSAELKPGGTQTDEAAMGGPFFALDLVLRDRFENLVDTDRLQARYRNLVPGNADNWVSEVVRRTELPDFKRRQGAPILRVSRRSLDWIDRRIPIAAVKFVPPRGGLVSPCEWDLLPRRPDFFPTSSQLVSP